MVASWVAPQFVQQNSKCDDLPHSQNPTDFAVAPFGRVVSAVVTVRQIPVVDFENPVPLAIGQFQRKGDAVGLFPSQVLDRTVRTSFETVFLRRPDHYFVAVTVGPFPTSIVACQYGVAGSCQEDAGQ